MRIFFLMLVCFGSLVTGAGAQSASTASSTYSCSPEEPAESSVTLHEVVDSLAFAESLRAYLADESLSLVGLEFGTNGKPERVEGYGAAGPAADARRLDRTLRPHLKARPATGKPTRVWLRVVDEASAEIEIARFSEACAPAFINRAEITTLLGSAYERVRRRRGGEGPSNLRRSILFIRVDAEGAPTEIRTHQGSRDSRWDSEVRRVLRLARFVPARRDDHVVSSWVSVPFTFAVH